MVILNYLNQHLNHIMKDLKDLVNHESPSLHKELVNNCGRFLKQLIGMRLGVQATEFPNETVGSHLKFEVGEGEEKLLILAHYDTVWEKGALSFRIEGSRAYGPGILDMKAGIIQAIWALKSLNDLHLRPNKKIVFLLTSDEEQLSPTSRELIIAEAKTCQAVFVVEPAVAKTGALKTARKGAGKYKIKAKGISSHAGNDPDLQASAVHEIAHQIRYLESLADPGQGTTINVGVIRGGTMSNVVAESAVAEVDVRFFTRAEGKRIEQAFCNLKPKLAKTKVEVEGGINRAPMEKSEASIRLFKLAQECAQELGFTVSEAAVGGVSDGNLTAGIGIPTLDGLGAVGEGPHAFHEHVIINEIPKRAALLAYLILKL
ncbi:peptidase M20 [Caldalkalibacillus thermarum]|uniref:M20 family metallopeptidase n=1 Tax=Caldalkalibacillus thermarum TaxID=296745 RepID=UPI001665B6AE|nr:M20 family metallopeptidase [Caldalkalibacillus thermarum]GGK29514.1 peptidase M20 [Caldalkalibacillus thermarum]